MQAKRAVFLTIKNSALGFNLLELITSDTYPRNPTNMQNKSQTSPISRRKFISAGGLSLAALAGGTGLHAGHHSSNAEYGAGNSLFDVPLDDDGSYLLPPLKYASDALEPAIDQKTTELHHGIHFESYRTGLNNTIKAMAEARDSDDFSTINQLQNNLAFNGAGYFLHHVFFDGMAPAGTTEPSSWLKERISEDFGSFEKMKAHFTATSAGVQGSGWGILGYQPAGKKLFILQVEKHQLATLWNIIPILALDVWEHAYYLNYQNRRGEYIKNWWDIVDWDVAEARVKAAEKL